MGLCTSFCKAKPLLDNMEKAKLNNEREKLGLDPLVTWQEEIEEKWRACKLRCHRRFCACCYCDFYLRCCGHWKCCQPGTTQNLLLRAMAAFMLGFLLTVLWYLMMVYQMKQPPLVACVASALLGTLICAGMACEAKVRCMVFLTLPTLFSSKGRSILLGYAFVLVLLHPMQNFNRNVIVMSESSTCGQEMAYNETKAIVDMAMAPVKSILTELKGLIKLMIEFAENVRKAFIELKQLIEEVLGSLDEAFGWLGEMVNVCNKKMGEPYQKCTRKFEEAKRKCDQKMGIMKFLCGIVSLVKNICHVARIGELLCHITKAVKNAVLSKINVKIMGAVHDMYEMFYFNVTLNYHYNLTMEQSKSYHEVRADILAEIEGRLNKFSFVGSVSYLGLTVMMIMLVSKAYLYVHKYRTKDNFDNHYISPLLDDIDERRKEMKKETILPLRKLEKRRYIKAKSVLLARSELWKMTRGAVLFLGAFLQGAFFMSCDLGLFWVLDTVRRLGSWKAGLDRPGDVKIYVQGEGILANIYKAVVNQFDPANREGIEFDTAPCLPNPSPPNYAIYKTILSIYTLAFVLLLTQSYGLRLRHVIAGNYYPARARARAVWLYNHILSKRGGGFLVHLRRQMRKQHTTDKAASMSLVARMAARSKLIGKVLRLLGYKQVHCLCCGVGGKGSDDGDFTHCANLGCSAAYCKECFGEINNMCTVCMNPVDYGDISDYSEEGDSSDPEPLTTFNPDPDTAVKPRAKMVKIPEALLDYTYQYKDRALTSSSEDEPEVTQPARRVKVRKKTSVNDLYDRSASSSGSSDNEW